MEPPRRRSVSRQRYAMRRVGVGVAAVAVLLLGGFAVVQLLAIVGGDDGDGGTIVAATVPEETAPPAGTQVTRAVPPSSADVDAPVSTPAPTTAAPTTAPATSVATAAPPTAADPARVLVVGDSDAGTFGPYLERLLDETGVVQTTVDYEVSSGLARPDFYDWPGHLADTLPAADPDIVVVTFGGNDAQGLSTVDGSNPAEWNDPVAERETWLAEYTKRAGAMMDQLAEGGRTVIWVGIPNDDSAAMTERLAVQNEAVEAALAERPGVQFVDTWSLFSSPNGGWAEYAVDPRDGQGKDVRADDGFHLNENGAEILAVKIAELVASDLHL